MKYHTITTILIFIVSFLSCQNKNDEADAYGNFEANEIRVASEGSGPIRTLQIEEGQFVEKGAMVGYIDTMQLHLKKEEIKAQKTRVASRKIQLNAEKEVLKAEKATALKEKRRIKQLLEDSAATQRQWDEITGKIEVLEKKINSVNSQYIAVNNELKVLDKKLDQAKDQLQNNIITNPVSGKVLVKYAEEGEITTIGKPLYKIADLNNMTLRAYISGAQLSNFELGQKVLVRIDKNKEDFKNYSGKISWIADEAEFTPKMIQTKEERVDLVYAIEVAVNNDGSIKIGMPGEMLLREN